jgi:hypothetical protein
MTSNGLTLSELLRRYEVGHDDNEEDECPHCDALGIFLDYTHGEGRHPIPIFNEMMSALTEIALNHPTAERHAMNVMIYAAMIEISNSIALEEVDTLVKH